MSAATVRIEGLEQLQKLGPHLVSGPMSRFMRAAGFVVQAHAMTNTRPNVFDGTVINSFYVHVDPSPIPAKTEIGNSAEHAPYLEKGTRPHFPPVAAIAPWAQAHGIEPYALALHISRHGTKAHPFLVPALNQSKGEIVALLSVAAAEIEALAAV